MDETFFNLVRDMRKAQKQYFATRTGSALKAAKQLERAVDEHIKKVEQQAIDRLQPRLF